jgi:hypothetical protein
MEIIAVAIAQGVPSTPVLQSLMRHMAAQQSQNLGTQ